ncbi:MAG: ATP-binding cassette domain-containing protein [Candidatus Hydrogenedentes bacterium]|nr:ATP-binding cassette domain-containing protein [Candidatus Hydrogenedentota bacterium]
MIQAEALHKTFYPPRGGPIEAVRGVSLAIQSGEIFGLLGPNGAGKTTLLRMLATIITPSAGWCAVDGIRADKDPVGVRRRVGFLSGNTKLYGRLTGAEFLRYFGRLYGMPDAAIAKRLAELAALFDMNRFIDRRCDTLSTGQAQKVSVARVLLHDPPVLVLDEPTLGLDIMTSRTILDFIAHSKDQGHSIVFSTHYMTEAELLCGRVGLMYRGRILAVGTQAELYERTGAGNLKDAFLRLVEQEEAP